MQVVLITLAATLLIQCGYFLWKLTADALPEVGKAPLPALIAGFLGNAKWTLGLIATIVG